MGGTRSKTLYQGWQVWCPSPEVEEYDDHLNFPLGSPPGLGPPPFVRDDPIP